MSHQAGLSRTTRRVTLRTATVRRTVAAALVAGALGTAAGVAQAAPQRGRLHRRARTTRPRWSAAASSWRPRSTRRSTARRCPPAGRPTPPPTFGCIAGGRRRRRHAGGRWSAWSTAATGQPAARCGSPRRSGLRRISTSVSASTSTPVRRGRFQHERLDQQGLRPHQQRHEPHDSTGTTSARRPTSVPARSPGATYDFRIDWTATDVEFYVDDHRPVATQPS